MNELPRKQLRGVFLALFYMPGASAAPRLSTRRAFCAMMEKRTARAELLPPRRVRVTVNSHGPPTMGGGGSFRPSEGQMRKERDR